MRERRTSNRKPVDSIHVTDVTTLGTYTLLAKEGHIIDASSSGLLMIITRKNIIPKEFKSSLSLEQIVGQQVALFLPQMNLDLDGTIRRATHRGRGTFEIAIDFSVDIPMYWRECLVDLLPSVGELHEAEESPES